MDKAALVLALREHARLTDDGCEDHDTVVDLMIRAADCIEGKVTLPITRYRGPLPGEPGDGESTFAIPDGATLVYVGPPVLGEPIPPRRPTFSEISFDGDDAASEVSILRGQLDDANAKIASLEATNAEVEGRLAAITAPRDDAAYLAMQAIKDEANAILAMADDGDDLVMGDGPSERDLRIYMWFETHAHALVNDHEDLGWKCDGLKLDNEKLRAALVEAISEWASGYEDQRCTGEPIEHPRIVELRKLVDNGDGTVTLEVR